MNNTTITITRKTLAAMLTLALALAFLCPRTTARDTVLYLHGPTNQPSLGTNKPTGSTPLAVSSGPLSSSNFVEIGTWTYVAFSRPIELDGLDDLHVWLEVAHMEASIANMDDHAEPDVEAMADDDDDREPRRPQKAKAFDLRAEILKNGQPIATGLERKIKNLKTMSRRGDSEHAKEIKVEFDDFDDTAFAPGDILALRLSARTVERDDRPTVSPGLFVFFDAKDRRSRFTADLDSIPAISITSTEVSEGNSGTTNAVLRVTLSERSSRTVSVRYATADGTATVADSDYTAKSGTLKFEDGETNKTITIRITGDRRVEPNEIFFVNLTNAEHALISIGTGVVNIRDDDGGPGPPLTVRISGTSVTEGDSGPTNARLAVILSGASTQPVSIRFATADDTATAADSDYIPTEDTLLFSPGVRTQFVSIPVIGDLRVEPDEFFTVNLTAATNATIATPQATVAILNDDSMPVIAVFSPERGAVTNVVLLRISGVAGPESNTIVRVEGGAFTVETTAAASGRFTVFVTLNTNRLNRLFLTAIDPEGRSSAPQPLEIIQDLQPPSLFIDFPADGTELFAETTDVTGRVGDMLSGFMGLNVAVNGEPASVNVGIGNNGTFARNGVPLALGTNLITAVATDISGNAVTKQISVVRRAVTGARLVAVSGNGQSAYIHRRLGDPIVVRAEDLDGTPRANQLLAFDVTRSDGRILPVDPLSLAGEPITNDVTRTVHGVMHLTLRTDTNGVASVFWAMGGDAGMGNNRLTVTASNISGAAFFCASANAQPPVQINIGSGNNQRGDAGAPAMEPLKAWVSDSCNGVEGIAVTFRIVQGGGKLFSLSPTGGEGQGEGAGTNELTVMTTRTGHATVLFSLGPDTGNNLIEATFPGNPGSPATFVLYGLARDPNTPTTFTGLVLDNSSRPIGGAFVQLSTLNVQRSTFTDGQGQFRFDAIPSGPAHLHVDGLTATNLNGQPIPIGSYPTLGFSTVIVPNAANSLPTPVLLPKLNPNNARIYDGSTNLVLTCEGMDGLKMTVQTGSMRKVDGTLVTPANPAIIALNQVHHDKVPMPMPDGAAPPFAWTLQPAGATFDPPIQIQYPNMSALPAGGIAYFLSFNHDTERFEIVASGHVKDDSTCIVTDPGAGLSVAGWGCNCPPYAVAGNCCLVSISGPKSVFIGDIITLGAGASPPGGTFGWSLIGSGFAEIVSPSDASFIQLKGIAKGTVTVHITYRPAGVTDPSKRCERMYDVAVTDAKVVNVAVHPSDPETEKVPSVLLGGRDHFVCVRDTGDIVLQATVMPDTQDVRARVSWEADGASITSPAVGSDKTTVALTSGVSHKIPIRIKIDGVTAWEGAAWVVWSFATAAPAPPATATGLYYRNDVSVRTGDGTEGPGVLLLGGTKPEPCSRNRFSFGLAAESGAVFYCIAVG